MEDKNTELGIGTLYDINKNIVLNHEIKLNEGVLNSKKEIIKNYLEKTSNSYYMLLCNERKDYTIFHIGSINEDIELDYTEKRKEAAKILVDECLKNRGEIRGIDLTTAKDAIEIWMIIDDDAYVYYFFPYDAAIIEI